MENPNTKLLLEIQCWVQRIGSPWITGCMAKYAFRRITYFIPVRDKLIF